MNGAAWTRNKCPARFPFLDEAIASLNESSNAELSRLLKEKLPGNQHRLRRPSEHAGGFHQRKVTLVRKGDRFALQNLASSRQRAGLRRLSLGRIDDEND